MIAADFTAYSPLTGMTVRAAVAQTATPINPSTPAIATLVLNGTFGIVTWLRKLKNERT